METAQSMHKSNNEQPVVQKHGSSLIELQGVSKVYGSNAVKVLAVDNVDLKIKAGEFTAIVGPSGSGKSTLLNLVSGLDVPTSGKVILAGKPIEHMSRNELSDFRRDNVGFIFQSFNLIPVLSAAENIEYIMLLQGVNESERRARTAEILKRVGLDTLANRRPHEISGGQQQRVAVARAMVSKPKLILADEPTANLDSKTGIGLLEMMRTLNEKDGMTFVFSTHDENIMDRAKRLIVLKDGKIDKDEMHN